MIVEPDLSITNSMDAKLFERYSRQMLFAPIGEAGQQRLPESSAVLVGCGALGNALANLLVRSGVGALRIIDRDFVETSNLQRQTLFEEADAQQEFPKAVAAERRLRAESNAHSLELKYQHLVESLPVTVYSFDYRTNRLDYVSPQGLELGN